MNYHDINKCDILNGNGIRVSLWVAGCEHRCPYCQNPQTWDASGGILFDESAKSKLFDALRKDYISGITITGGDPLHTNNLEDILNLVNKIHLLFPQKTIWLYTGYTWEELMVDSKRKEIVSMCDVIVDGRYIDEKCDITLKWRGSSNQRVINVKQSISEGKIVLYEI